MSDNLNTIADAFLAASLPIDPDSMRDAAAQVISYYDDAPSAVALPADEVAGRFAEMWDLWLREGGIPSAELCDVVNTAVSVAPEMRHLGSEYFRVENKLEEKTFMERAHAVALLGCSPLIRTLVMEQHLGLDRIRSVINVPGATFDAIKSVLNGIGIAPSFNPDSIQHVYEGDVEDVSALFGDTPPEEADATFKGLLGNFSRSDSFGEDVCELVYIGFEPYLFLLYYEFLTLESTDRFPGRAVYECNPRGGKVKALWNEMYNPTQENPYLNNAKSVYSLDTAWAETKLSRETQNGSIMLANVFDIMAELPYTTRRKVAHVTRCYLTLMANHKQISTSLPAVTPANVTAFVETVGAANSMTKGVLDQRLVEFLTMCVYGDDDWFPRGLGSSVNESNASGRKYGDVEYYDVRGRKQIHAFEAHGGGLRDEYVEDHVNSLKGTVDYYTNDAAQRDESYEREVEIVYVAHDVSRLMKYRDGYSTSIEGVSFTFRFITFGQLLDEAGGIDAVAKHTGLFDDLIHQRISRLPDAYALKKRYCEAAGVITDAEK